MSCIGTGRLGVAFCLAALVPLIGPAAAAEPTVQELLAAQDRALVNSMVAWEETFFTLPSDVKLDETLREAAVQLASEHLARSRTLWPEWMAQERAASGDANLQGGTLSRPLFLHAINELAIWSLENGGPAQDDAWLKAALAPMACSSLPRPYFARRIAMIQAAPLDARPALLAGERDLLSRWGTKRQSLPTRPAAADLEAADQAITLLRAGLPITAVPMTPFLADRLFDRKRKPDPSDRWEQCAKSQWWLASQLADGKVDRSEALTLWRYSTMFDVNELIPDSVEPSAGTSRLAAGKPAYPLAATYFSVEGVTTVQVDTDALGNLLKARVVSRKLTVPGVRDNPPVAFETLLDAASLDLAAKPGQLAKKSTGFKFDAVWRLEE